MGTDRHCCRRPTRARVGKLGRAAPEQLLQPESESHNTPGVARHAKLGSRGKGHVSRTLAIFEWDLRSNTATLQISVSLILAGVFIGLLGSGFALRRYLKV